MKRKEYIQEFFVWMKEPPVTPINPPATPQLPKYVRAALLYMKSESAVGGGGIIMPLGEEGGVWEAFGDKS
jgi:hypothetical protein